MEFNWNLSTRDATNITKIVDRAFDLCAQQGVPTGEKINLRMDLIATHNHACRLNLVKLRKAPDFDFMHDVLGIGRHLNRETGELENSFWPRCARV